MLRKEIIAKVKEFKEREKEANLKIPALSKLKKSEIAVIYNDLKKKYADTEQETE